MSETLLLLVTAAGVWFVVDALRAREAAVRVAREACREHGLQLLDDTVQGTSLTLRWPVKVGEARIAIEPAVP